MNDTNNSTQENANVTVEIKPVEETNTEEVRKKEFPFMAISIALILIMIFLSYYFFYLTPTRVFDEAIENIFDNIKSVASGITNSESDTIEIDLNGKLKTSGKDYKNVEDIAFLNNLKVNANIEVDLKKLDFGATIKSDVKETSNMKYPQNMDVALDSIDNNLYFKINDTIAKYNSNGKLMDKIEFRYDRIEDAVSIFESMKNQVVNIIKEEQLSKTIATRKINNQTAVAIKAHTTLNNKDIASIYYEGFGNIIKDKKLIKKWANVFSITEEEAIARLQRILDRDVVTEAIEVNLYMNLANTQLIGLDIRVDNFYVEINSLNGFYYIDFKVFNSKGIEALDIEVEYDAYHGVLNGIGTANVSLKGLTTGFLIVKFDYTRINAEDTNTMVGNKLDFKFYDDRSDIPFCTLDCTLDLAYDKKIDFLDIKKSKNVLELTPTEIEDVITLADKITYETLFVAKRLIFNRLPSSITNDINKKIEIKSRDLVEKEMINIVEANLKDLPKEQLTMLLDSKEVLLNKLYFVSNENKKDFIRRLVLLKENLVN